jgi:hypothetical protein
MDKGRAKIEFWLTVISTLFTVLGVLWQPQALGALWQTMLARLGAGQAATPPVSPAAPLALLVLATLALASLVAYLNRRRAGGDASRSYAWLAAPFLLVLLPLTYLVGRQRQPSWLLIPLAALGLIAWVYWILPRTSADLPAADYDVLVGRGPQLAHLFALLRGQRQVVLLTGIGGVGKTALAYEAVRRLRQPWRLWLPRFERVVWSSAKMVKFGPSGMAATERTGYDLNSLLNDLIRQTDAPISFDAVEQGKRDQVAAYLARRRILLVVDNLDTIADALLGTETAAQRERVFLTFCQLVIALLGVRCRLLITSRYRFAPTEAVTLDLPGLDAPATRRLAQREERRLAVVNIVNASPEELSELFRLTGGVPLMIKLVVGICQHQPVAVALASLSAVASRPVEEGYAYIFDTAWKLLSAAAQRTLIALTTYAPETGGEYRQAAQLLDEPAAAFADAVRELQQMSLVEAVGRGTAGTWLQLHQLTHTYVERVLGSGYTTLVQPHS